MKPDSNPPLSSPDPEQVEAAAAVWLSLRDRGMTKAETAEFMRWLQQDTRHAEAFNALDRVWREFNRAAAIRPAEAAEPDIDLLAPRARPRRRRPMLVGALAAAAAIALAWVGIQVFDGPRPTAETAVGAFQRLELADGSVVQLNTDSAVRVRFADDARRVELLRGEAYFSVAKDPTRPFTVNAGPVAVRAVGTAFNVRLRPEAVEVLVTKGKVAVRDMTNDRSPQITDPNSAGTASSGNSSPVSSFLLGAGERALVPMSATQTAVTAAPASAVVEPVDEPAIERALAWQERRLEFDATPLSEVVAEFNRYNHHQLVIADPWLAGKQFGGAFRADAYEAFVNLLESSFGVVAEHEDNRTVLHSHR